MQYYKQLKPAVSWHHELAPFAQNFLTMIKDDYGCQIAGDLNSGCLINLSTHKIRAKRDTVIISLLVKDNYIKKNVNPRNLLGHFLKSQ